MPVAAFLAPVLMELARNGLGILAGAIEAKGKEVIEEKLGIEIPSKAEQLTPELLQRLQEKQMEHEQFLINARVQEKQIDFQNTADARAMQIAALKSDDKFVRRFLYYFAVYWSLFATSYITAVTFQQIPEGNEYYVSTVLGFLLGTLIGTLITFFYGGVHRSNSTRTTDVPSR